MGKNFLLNISEVIGLKYTPNNLFFTNVPDKKSTKIFLSYMIPDGSFNVVRSKRSHLHVAWYPSISPLRKRWTGC